jgi:soluble lytic murein transglycosylase-like protein
LKIKSLLLIAALVPAAALYGCSSTGTDTAASFDLAPGDPALPEMIALEPGQAGEIVGAASFAGTPNPGQAAASIQAVAEAVPGKVAAKSARLQSAAVPEAKPLALAAVKPTPAALRMGAPVVKAVATPADLVVLPVTPAAYVKADKPLDVLIAKYAAVYDVPLELVRHVVKRESNFNPAAFNRGHYGLMQIKHATARGMGYAGSARGLFDAETNLKYAVKYLRGAYLVADGNMARADRLYQTGYYYHAKRKGLLDETGLGRDRERRRKPAPELP